MSAHSHETLADSSTINDLLAFKARLAGDGGDGGGAGTGGTSGGIARESGQGSQPWGLSSDCGSEYGVEEPLRWKKSQEGRGRGSATKASPARTTAHTTAIQRSVTRQRARSTLELMGHIVAQARMPSFLSHDHAESVTWTEPDANIALHVDKEASGIFGYRDEQTFALSESHRAAAAHAAHTQRMQHMDEVVERKMRSEHDRHKTEGEFIQRLEPWGLALGVGRARDRRVHRRRERQKLLPRVGTVRHEHAVSNWRRSSVAAVPAIRPDIVPSRGRIDAVELWCRIQSIQTEEAMQAAATLGNHDSGSGNVRTGSGGAGAADGASPSRLKSVGEPPYKDVTQVKDDAWRPHQQNRGESTFSRPRSATASVHHTMEDLENESVGWSEESFVAEASVPLRQEFFDFAKDKSAVVGREGESTSVPVHWHHANHGIDLDVARSAFLEVGRHNYHLLLTLRLPPHAPSHNNALLSLCCRL